MTWGSSSLEDGGVSSSEERRPATSSNMIKTCPSCGHRIQFEASAVIQDFPGLPAGVKFDPTDVELLEHLGSKLWPESRKLHPLIDQFIPTIEGENGICYTHPEKLPGVGKDGLIRHFFHRPSKAYTTGTRKRRKVHTDEQRGETRWHKTGKTRPVYAGNKLLGFKKILVLYTNYGKQRKPEKTNWVMHQYHIGSEEDEKDGELVVSKVFYQTQPRQCGALIRPEASSKVHTSDQREHINISSSNHSNILTRDQSIDVGFYGQTLTNYNNSNQGGSQYNRSAAASSNLMPNFPVHAGRGSSFLP